MILFHEKRYAYASLLDVNFKLFLRRVRRRVFFLKIRFAANYLARVIRPYSDISIKLFDEDFSSLNITNKASNYKNWTIVIQGPVNSQPELHFLTRNLKFLNANYPGVRIVISSYSNCNPYLDQLDKNLFNKMILLNSNDYKNNFERQVASTHAGMKQSQKWGTPFSVKMRTDQKIVNPASLQLFETLINKFKDSKSKTKTRIIFGSYNSWLYRPFGLSDMFTAGLTEEVSEYWKFNHEITNFDIKYHHYPEWLESKTLFFETFLNMRYLNKHKFKFSKDKFKDTSEALRDYFLVVDSPSIGHKWLKRSDLWSGNSIIKAGFDLPSEALLELDFITWLLIKHNVLTIRPNELASRH